MTKLKFLIVLCLIVFQYDFAFCQGLLGPAEASIKNVEQCDNPEQYPTKIYITRRKLNRTHDAFDGNVSLSEDWDEKVGLNLNVAKWGDGGYKPNYYIVNEKRSCDFLMQYVGEGFKKILRESNAPEKCPIKKTTLMVKNYVINYKELPETLIYGDFRLDAGFYLNQIENKLSCTKAFAIVKPKTTMG